MRTSRKVRLLILVGVLGCMVGCDQTSKHVARTELSRLGSIALPGGIGEFRLVENPGAFLSLGASLPARVRMGIFLGAGLGLLILSTFLVSRRRLGWMTFLGLALVLAGGLGNLIDRITREGLVTDFILLQVGPFHTGIFNVADAGILLGIALVVVSQWQERHRVLRRRAPVAAVEG